MHTILSPNRLALLGCLAVACGGSPEPRDAKAPSSSIHVTSAKFSPAGSSESRAAAAAELQRTGKKDRGPAGKLELEQEGDRVTLSGKFRDLPPGVRGIQIHEEGDCTGKARRAGEHFDPTDARHGPPESPERHVGDLGNIRVNEDGKALFQMTTDSLTVTEDGPSSVLERSVVITRLEDDGKSQPHGNAGPAIACGVIRAR